ncbi:UNVERIFIED_CONTAM: hypothetical protein K2H54_036171 [Gekko kuhli]
MTSKCCEVSQVRLCESFFEGKAPGSRASDWFPDWPHLTASRPPPLLSAPAPCQPPAACRLAAEEHPALVNDDSCGRPWPNDPMAGEEAGPPITSEHTEAQPPTFSSLPRPQAHGVVTGSLPGCIWQPPGHLGSLPQRCASPYPLVGLPLMCIQP